MVKENKKGTKGYLIGGLVLIAVIVLFSFIYKTFGAKPVEGSKEIIIEVVNKDGETTNHEVKTDAEFLKQAMEETEDLIFSGEESEFGMMVDTVNGVKADYTVDNSYWSFFVNDEYCTYGIETQPVVDGDKFSIVYTTDTE